MPKDCHHPGKPGNTLVDKIQPEFRVPGSRVKTPRFFTRRQMQNSEEGVSASKADKKDTRRTRSQIKRARVFAELKYQRDG